MAGWGRTFPVARADADELCGVVKQHRGCRSNKRKVPSLMTTRIPHNENMPHSLSHKFKLVRESRERLGEHTHRMYIRHSNPHLMFTYHRSIQCAIAVPAQWGNREWDRDRELVATLDADAAAGCRMLLLTLIAYMRKSVWHLLREQELPHLFPHFSTLILQSAWHKRAYLCTMMEYIIPANSPSVLQNFWEKITISPCGGVFVRTTYSMRGFRLCMWANLMGHTKLDATTHTQPDRHVYAYNNFQAPPLWHRIAQSLVHHGNRSHFRLCQRSGPTRNETLSTLLLAVKESIFCVS